MQHWGIWRQVRFTIVIPLLCPVAVAAQDHPALQARVATTLREAGPGTRFGLVVLDDTGAEVVAIAPDDRFVPASTTKIVTTAAVFATMGDLSAPDTAAGATVGIADGDVVLTGHGDARLSSAADCVRDCLATLADAIAGATRTVHDVIGDDSLYPDRRWSPGMGWNNIATRSGTAISALTLDDNVLRLVVTADGHGGARIAALPYFTIDAHIVAGARTEIGIDRQPGSRILRVEGTIASDAPPQVLYAGIDDPADYAAWRLRTMLLARNVRVTGMIRTRHRPAATTARPLAPLARAEPAPLGEDLMLTNKTSQNLHAELLLRRLDAATGGTATEGASAVTAMLTRAGVERWRYDFADGSGMSTYNRVSPRGIARFLRWTQTQPWGANWRATLPIGGIDGTLSRRFVGTPLAGRLWAKTGTLNGASALAGFLTARSGQELSFALYANDMPEGAAVTKAMDAALLLIAAEN